MSVSIVMHQKGLMYSLWMRLRCQNKIYFRDSYENGCAVFCGYSYFEQMVLIGYIDLFKKGGAL